MNTRRPDWARIGAGCAAAALIATTLSPADLLARGNNHLFERWRFLRPYLGRMDR